MGVVITYGEYLGLMGLGFYGVGSSPGMARWGDLLVDALKLLIISQPITI
jgi:ABC-type dipeptide/oligopeptide/nickel transport system permease subunit